MELKPGTRLRSQVDATEIIVVRPPTAEVELSCGGHPMIDAKAEAAPGLTADPAATGGTELGKRYTDGEAALEVLVTKPGTSSLAAAGSPLVLKEAKPLPASD
ncbi:hypothetical protein LWP59_17370 [Amycolatopsis acidiphila]|uniref:Uncharacterized protein n=1 Tax=Amycolatopsis acidiphila TaxID=715473 RepID=A0A558AP39_9PSEU|nr:hypothetical protein [Amycolatopsis acidiphila]TVT26008.1 hypothetical protein FNH06_00850 [Amycolatopsis acidiphila]UIJ63278.1 hypothetical protein LWP59_17370 [Amycolatopsis acidiphila]GHG74740.1 hypothetical protein GCM10017788_38970 [Amycolatopsis acidiphila]